MLPPPTDTPVLSPAPTLVDGRIVQRYSAAKRYSLLVIFCLAQFLDAVNNSALFSALPSLVVDLHMSPNESTWIISAFQLTFASFLLISGRISDVYNPKMAFITGVTLLGILSIGGGFATNKIVLIVLRALSGLAASLTIPSALTLLVDVFPEKKEQARAIGIFGGCGAVGNVLGLIIGAIFVQVASWSWVFWFVALIAIPIGLLCTFLVPSPVRGRAEHESGKARWRSLDLGGVSILTAALILLIFAVTSGGSSAGWDSAMVIAPLIISVAMIVGFFYFETRISENTAAVPPRTWFLPNFSSLFGVALMPYLWWTALFAVLTPLWQEVYEWSAISVALRMIPVGALAFAASFSGPLSDVFEPKYIILFGQVILMIATILLALADAPSKYFSHVLPGFILGSAGAMLTFTHANIAIFRTVPSNMAGTVGAIFNGALQLGSAVGIAAVSSIEASVEAKLPKTAGGSVFGVVSEYQGQAAGFWFLLGVVGLEFLNILVFYRVREVPKRDVESIREEVCEKEEEVVDEDAKGVPVEKEDVAASDSVRYETEVVG
ncbi:major facilitator superfamily domain-containing protein [Cytidiella melzeri]|nr:major facilitator superfamily domain-containing protein [Cytidiella melzeri]